MPNTATRSEPRRLTDDELDELDELMHLADDLGVQRKTDLEVKLAALIREVKDHRATAARMKQIHDVVERTLSG